MRSAGSYARVESRRAVRLLAGLCLVAIATSVISLAYDRVPLLEDTARHLLLAKDCAQFSACSIGAPSSWLLWEGGLWVRLLALMMRVGVNIDHLRILVIVAHVVAAVILYAAMRRFARPMESALASAIAVGLNLLVAGAPVIWNVSLVPLAAAALFWSLVRLTETQRLRFAVAAGIAAAVCAEFQLAGIGVLLPTVALVAAFAARPLASLIGTLVGFGAVPLLASATAVERNLQRLPWELTTVALSGLVTAVIIGFAARPWGQARAPRLRILVAVAVVGVGTIVPLVLSPVLGHAVAWRYFPLLPAGAAALAAWCFALLGGGVVGRALGAGAITVGALVLVHGWVRAQARELVSGSGAAFSFSEATRIGEALVGDGLSFNELASALHAEGARELVLAMGTLFPLEADHRPRGTSILLLPWDATRPDIPGARTIDLGRRRSAVLVGFPAYVVRERALVCSPHAETDACIEAARWSSRMSRSRYRDRWDVADRALCEGRPGSPRRARFEIDMRHSDGPHLVWSPEGTIAAISGVSYSGELPARSAWLLDGDQRTGTIEIDMNPRSCFLPDVVEVPGGAAAEAFAAMVAR